MSNCLYDFVHLLINAKKKPNADSDDDSEGDSVLIRQKVWPRISKQGINDLEARKKVLMKSAYDASKRY